MITDQGACVVARKGFWSELLGINDFYYELGVQIIEVCLATRGRNGGLIEMSELLNHVRRRRGHAASAISSDDLERAVTKLDALGGEFRVISAGQRRMLQSIPTELSTDHTAIIGLAASGTGITQSSVAAAQGWPQERAATAISMLLQEGLAWADDQHPSGERAFWFPSLILP